MSTPEPFGGAYRGARVLVTGHTGFKGAWLVRWLLELGAEVHGYALEPPTDPSLFDELGLAEDIAHTLGDIRDGDAVRRVMADSDAEVVMHLAAQPLVRRSYAEPVYTYETNVIGTANVLEAVREAGSVRAAVVVTSDKCYENREWDFAYRENDRIGGRDPYSSSKGCAELVTAAYSQSYFGPESTVRVASARAGNVIGGGDWAEDRLVPDCVRALSAGEPVGVRNPEAVRPWQHVLEPLSGYLLLGARMLETSDASLDTAWNFGPEAGSAAAVRDVADAVTARWGSGSWHTPSTGPQPHEAHLLRLDCTRAATLLGWRPVWGVDRAVAQTVDWYRARHEDPGCVPSITGENIDAYVADARTLGVAGS